MKILIVGVSTRAMAQSAVAAGHDVISLDYFSDRDQPPEARVLSLNQDFKYPLTLKNLARATASLAPEADGVVVGAGLENEPAFFDLNASAQWLCNPRNAVTKARDPSILAKIIQGTECVLPKTILPGQDMPQKGTWLVKNLEHSGGNGVRYWKKGTKLSKGSILQEFINGRLASATFLADGKKAILLGMTIQYSGVKVLNAREFSWSGNVAPYQDPSIQHIISIAIQKLTKSISLVGLNGMDFIIKDNQCFLIEVNPRYSGSVELFEKLLGINAFSMHLDACQGHLPRIAIKYPVRRYFGKAILYTKNWIKLGSTDGWNKHDIADIPHSGEVIPPGAPVCTLFNEASDPDTCWQGLLEKTRILQENSFA